MATVRLGLFLSWWFAVISTRKYLPCGIGSFFKTLETRCLRLFWKRSPSCWSHLHTFTPSLCNAPSVWLCKAPSANQRREVYRGRIYVKTLDLNWFCNVWWAVLGRCWNWVLWLLESNSLNVHRQIHSSARTDRLVHLTAHWATLKKVFIYNYKTASWVRMRKSSFSGGNPLLWFF